MYKHMFWQERSIKNRHVFKGSGIYTKRRYKDKIPTKMSATKLFYESNYISNFRIGRN